MNRLMRHISRPGLIRRALRTTPVFAMLSATACLGEFPEQGNEGVLLALASAVAGDEFRIVSMEPAEGATDVELTPQIRIQFSAEVEPASLGVQATDGPCTGALQLSANDFASCRGLSLRTDANPVIVAAPLSPLTEATLYRARISGSVASEAGRRLGADALLSFTTGSAAVPQVLQVTSPDSGAFYNIGDVVLIDVVFSRDAFVTGMPQLQLNVAPNAQYVNGSGTTTLRFEYTVQGGDNAAPLNAAGLVLGAGEAIQSNTGVDANLSSLPTAGPSALEARNLTADTSAPTFARTYPEQGMMATHGLANDGSIVLYFGEALDPGTLSVQGADAAGSCPPGDTIQIESATTCEGATVETSGNAVIVTPVGTWAAPNTLNVTIAASVRDFAGNPLGASVALSFLTENFAAARITDVMTALGPGATRGPAGGAFAITLDFNGSNLVVFGGPPPPELALNSGGNAACTASLNDLICSYTPAPGQNATRLGYNGRAALNFASGKYVHDGTTHADIVLPANAATTDLYADNITIDGSAPTFTGLRYVRYANPADIELFWDAAADNYTPQANIVYRTFRDLNCPPATLLGVQPANGATMHTDLTVPVGDRCYRINACDAVNNCDANAQDRVSVRQSLLALYPLDASSAGADNSGAYATTLQTGAVSLLADPRDYAANAQVFDGATYYRLSGAGLLPGADAVRTICAWINPSNLDNAGTRIIFGYGGTATADDAFALGHIGGVLVLERNGAFLNAGTLLGANQWQHVCAVRQGGGETDFFIDGAAAGSVPGAVYTTPTPADIFIGAWPGLGDPFEGAIFEARIYSNALSAARIQELYNNR